MNNVNKFSDRYLQSHVSVLSPKRLRSGDIVFNPITIEQLGTQPFALKSNGFPRSEISMLAKASSELELQAALRQMREAQGKKVKMTYAEAMKQIKPRFIDLPHEREMYAEYIMNTTGKSLDDLYRSTNTTDEVTSDSKPAE